MGRAALYVTLLSVLSSPLMALSASDSTCRRPAESMPVAAASVCTTGRICGRTEKCGSGVSGSGCCRQPSLPARLLTSLQAAALANNN